MEVQQVLHCDEGMYSLFLKIIFWSVIGAVLLFSLRLLGTDPTTFVVLSYLLLGGAWMYQRDRMRYHYLDKMEVIEKERDELKANNRELTQRTERLEKELDIVKNGEWEEILYED